MTTTNTTTTTLEEDDNAADVEQNNNTTKCFTLIHQRRFWATASCTSTCLCPSMDLLSLGLIAPVTTTAAAAATQSSEHTSTSSTANNNTKHLWLSNSLHLHRTVNWQKLAIIAAPAAATTTTTTTTTTTERNTSTSTSPTSSILFTHAVWRPDGRFVAVADTLARISLYSVEEMLNNSNSNSNNITHSNLYDTFDITHDELDHVPGKVHTTKPLLLTKNDNNYNYNNNNRMTITGMTWAHIGPPHSSWPNKNDDNDDDVSNIMWKYRSQFIDREEQFLPPSEYHVRTHHQNNNNNYYYYGSGSSHQGEASNRNTPTCQTPLSVLYVVTQQQQPQLLQQEQQQQYLNLYLHGRFPIALNLPLNHTNGNTTTTTTSTDGTPNTPSSSLVVASHDLSHVLIVCHPQLSFTLYSIPSLSQHRYILQQVAALYSKTMTHLKAIQQQQAAIAASWKSSLKPLDLKLDGLLRLLQNYGLIDNNNNNNDTTNHDEESSDNKNNQDTTGSTSNLRALLVQYILSGSTRSFPNLSNAMDQFFTGVQMNDQLLVRMERSLAAAVCNVEKALKQNLVAPATALQLTLSSLQGLSRYRPDILNPTMTQSLLLMTSQVLYVSIETTYTALVDARFRLRDFVAWLRSVGSQIKARGTALKSVQRDNAKKRRVPDTTVHRMLQYLQQPTNTTSSSSSSSSSSSTTEQILALQFSSLLQKHPTAVVMNHHTNKRHILQQQQQPLNSSRSPLVSSSVSLNQQSDTKPPSSVPTKSNNSNHKVIPTIPHATEKTMQAAERVFAFPGQFLTKSIHQTQFRLQQQQHDDNHNNNNNNNNTTTSKMAMITRMGRGGIQMENLAYGESTPEGFFCPRTAEEEDEEESLLKREDEQMPLAEDFRQWSIVASRCCCCPNDVDSTTIVQLHAIPLTWSHSAEHNVDFDGIDGEDDDNDDTKTGLAAMYQWSCALALPTDCTICEMAFYSDDGKSSLSAFDDSSSSGGTGQEGRQGLGLLVHRNNSKNNKLELWLINYDEISSYHCIPMKQNDETGEIILTSLDSIGIEPLCVQPMNATTSDGNDDDDSNNNNNNNNNRVVMAKTRVLSLPSPPTTTDSLEDYQCHLVLSGSRGIGAVFASQHGGTSMEIMDLEEDEEEEEEEEEEMDAEEEEEEEEEDDREMKILRSESF